MMLVVKCCKLLNFTCRGMIRQANVHTICTTDDPVDSLEYHRLIKNGEFEVNVLPAWRPDKSDDGLKTLPTLTSMLLRWKKFQELQSLISIHY